MRSKRQRELTKPSFSFLFPESAIEVNPIPDNSNIPTLITRVKTQRLKNINSTISNQCKIQKEKIKIAMALAMNITVSFLFSRNGNDHLYKRKVPFIHHDLFERRKRMFGRTRTRKIIEANQLAGGSNGGKITILVLGEARNMRRRIRELSVLY